MRADFEMTSGLFQARPVSRLIARVTYHAAAPCRQRDISAVELRRGGAERFHVLYVGVPGLRMRDQHGRYREIIA